MSRELCIMACVFCRDPLFQEWAIEQVMDQRLALVGCQLTVLNEPVAKAFILHVCEVSSRNDLDVDEDAAQRFHILVRKPFLEWKEGQ